MAIQRNVLSLSLQETHELIIHQVIVQVQGWAALSPVSVDRVGTFFRQARRQQVETASIVRGSLELKVLQIHYILSLSDSTCVGLVYVVNAVNAVKAENESLLVEDSDHLSDLMVPERLSRKY